MHRCQLFCHNQGIYLNEFMQVVKHQLFHEEGSCRTETNPLICRANFGFCIIWTFIMKDSGLCSSTYTESML